MKRYYIVGILGLLILGGIAFESLSRPVTVQNPQIEVQTVEVEKDPLDAEIEALEAEIMERKAWEARLEAEIEAHEARIASSTERIQELRTELGKKSYDY